jgi:hypothetical protein
MKRYTAIIVILSFLILLSLTNPVSADIEKGSGPSINGVQIFPPDDIWNVAVDHLPVDPHSADYVSKIGRGISLHPDFGSGLWDGHKIGIPFNIVSGPVTKTTVIFYYPGESDNGPYPIPPDPVTEGGSDRHILILDQDERALYELFDATREPDGSWHAGSGAIFNLDDYALRPAGWTSADAAGLPILPGLVRYDEVSAGEITHAVRFTAPSTQRAYVWPARHYASTITDPMYPPMGERFRLKSSFDTSGYPYQARVILDALKKYGMILADNGGAWFISGAPDERWDNEALHTLAQLKGSDFEAVDTSSLMINQDSSQARTSSQPTPAGSIDIVSSPAGATVLLDNLYIGITPLILTNITPGSHTIRCTKSGYSEQSQVITVLAYQTANVNVILESLQSYGAIVVQSHPSGARIYLDNIDTGYITPATLQTVTSGNHTIRCSLAGYYDNSTVVPVTPLQLFYISLDLTDHGSSIKLGEGWNFVSVPVLHPQSPYPDLRYYPLFAEVDNAGHSSWRYHADSHNWEILYPNSTLSPLDGIWIYAAIEKTIPVAGDNVLAPAEKHLYKGWNSIGYAGAAKPASGALTSLSDKWIMLFCFDSTGKQYNPTIFFNDPTGNTSLSPGRGYWIFMDDEGDYSLSPIS